MNARRLVVALVLTASVLLVPALTRSSFIAPQGKAPSKASSMPKPSPRPKASGAKGSCPMKAPAAFFEQLNFKPDGTYPQGTSLTGVLRVCAANAGAYNGTISVTVQEPGKNENPDWNT